MRRALIDRKTRETSIRLELRIEGKGRYDVSTGIRFFDHMLELFARHGAFDLALKASGDLDVDQHHTVEDVGIALGEAVTSALGTRRGINRAGYFVMPMDETLADGGQVSRAVVDESNHNSPLVEGSIRPSWRSFEHATRSARANALKIASTW